MSAHLGLALDASDMLLECLAEVSIIADSNLALISWGKIGIVDYDCPKSNYDS